MMLRRRTTHGTPTLVPIAQLRRSRSALAVLTVAIVAALAGCAPSGNSVGMPGMDHGAGAASPGPAQSAMADTMFIMMMIPHHEQAIEMSDIVLAKSDIDPRVVELAQQIKDAQAPEIELMEEWLDEWGLPSSGAMGAMDHGDGMMSEDDMAALEAAEGTAAAQLFLEQMIEHHEGAIEMAEDELERGDDSDVRALAQQIIDSQTAEIAVMQELIEQI
jgi:uncharacterized protein (DUF305 family)